MNLKKSIHRKNGFKLLFITLLFISCNSKNQESSNKTGVNLDNDVKFNSETKIKNEDILRFKIDSSVISNYGNKIKIIGKRVYNPTGKTKDESGKEKEVINPNLVFGEARLLIDNDTSYWRMVFENEKIIHEGPYNPNK
mgnify:CR=1 FL=1